MEHGTWNMGMYCPLFHALCSMLYEI
jgi:hypothetical protein